MGRAFDWTVVQTELLQTLYERDALEGFHRPDALPSRTNLAFQSAAHEKVQGETQCAGGGLPLGKELEWRVGHAAVSYVAVWQRGRGDETAVQSGPLHPNRPIPLQKGQIYH